MAGKRHLWLLGCGWRCVTEGWEIEIQAVFCFCVIELDGSLLIALFSFCMLISDKFLVALV